MTKRRRLTAAVVFLAVAAVSMPASAQVLGRAGRGAAKGAMIGAIAGDAGKGAAAGAVGGVLLGGARRGRY